MRSRSRRSASNYFSAALLELSIMGIFVVIAQPQLRQAFIELVHPVPVASGAGSTGGGLKTSWPATPAVWAPTSAAASAAASVQSLLVRTFSDGDLKSDRGPERRSLRTAHYAPLEHYESFHVSLPTDNLCSTSLSAQPNAPQSRIAHYAPTQLVASDGNIAAAAQSPPPLSGWTAARPSDAGYRDVYPPPYGTQSQWK